MYHSWLVSRETSVKNSFIFVYFIQIQLEIPNFSKDTANRLRMQITEDVVHRKFKSNSTAGN